MASDAKACFSSKVEYCAVIRYLYLKGKTGKEIHSELADVYGSSAPSYAQVKFWVGEFKRGRTSLEDEARSGRPLDATDEEMCKKVRDLVYSDSRASVKRTYDVYYALRLPPDVQIELQRLTADFRNFFCPSEIDTRDVQKLSNGPPTFNQLYDVCPAYLPEIRYLC